MTSGLEFITRCTAKPNGGGSCGSAVFFDWGLQVLNTTPIADVRGGNIDRFNDYAQPNSVKICARCNTPFLLQAGELIDLSDELTTEDVQGIIARGRGSVVPPRVRDP